MANFTYACQVTHQVIETYRIDARSGTEAAMQLGAYLASMGDGEHGVELVSTRRTRKSTTAPRVLIDGQDSSDDDVDAVESHEP